MDMLFGREMKDPQVSVSPREGKKDRRLRLSDILGDCSRLFFCQFGTVYFNFDEDTVCLKDMGACHHTQILLNMSR
jgi:hypothetical protein